MKKIKKILIVSLMIIGFTMLSNGASSNTCKIFQGISYISNANREQSVKIYAANAACDICMIMALAGSGITAGGSLAVGLVIGG